MALDFCGLQIHHTPLWAHVINAEQEKRCYVVQPVLRQRHSWVARGGYADDCALQGFLLPLSTSIYEKQHDALTLGQNEANGSYSHYFPRVALENKQVNTQRSFLSPEPAPSHSWKFKNGKMGLLKLKGFREMRKTWELFERYVRSQRSRLTGRFLPHLNFRRFYIIGTIRLSWMCAVISHLRKMIKGKDPKRSLPSLPPLPPPPKSWELWINCPIFCSETFSKMFFTHTQNHYPLSHLFRKRLRLKFGLCFSRQEIKIKVRVSIQCILDSMA